MERHISDRDIVLYIYRLVPDKMRVRIDEHISKCTECMLRLTELMSKKIEACRRMRRLFSKAYEDSLEPEDARFWDAHIKVCRGCAESYAEFVRKKEMGFFPVVVGYIRDFFEKLEYGISPPVYEPVLYGKTGEKLDIKNVISLKRKGVSVVLVVEADDRIKAYVSSKKYMPSGVRITLARRKGKELEKLREATTDSEGVADLGRLSTLPPPASKKGYAVVVNDLGEKG